MQSVNNNINEPLLYPSETNSDKSDNHIDHSKIEWLKNIEHSFIYNLFIDAVKIEHPNYPNNDLHCIFARIEFILEEVIQSRTEMRLNGQKPPSLKSMLTPYLTSEGVN